MSDGRIRVGVGGWDYDPWRENFYPPRLSKAKQLGHMAGRLTAVEVNATYYKLQKPELYERWAKAVPDDFRFTVKGSRFCSNRKVLGEAGEAVERFCSQGWPSWATSWARCCGSSWRRSASSRTISGPSWPCCRAGSPA